MRFAKTLMMVFGAALLTGGTSHDETAITDLDLKALAKISETDPRFQSFNIEMVEITGGRFWAPYDDPSGARYARRPPTDLSNKRLNILAAGLAPAYLRVSGTWANSTYVPRIDEAPVALPPEGFNQVLTNAQWRDAIAFARTNDLALITSFPVSLGTRDADGRWSIEQAQRLLALTHHFGGRIAAAEFINEPNLTKLGRLPDGYALSDYARDFAIFRDFAKRVAPDMLILGPGSSGEGGDLTATDMMRITAGGVDVVSYHFYGALSKRCPDSQTTADQALSEEWLSRTERDFIFYAGLRDRYEPRKDIWLTETAQAACGGSPWAATFRDSFRYVGQLGRLAQRGVKVVAHNTLAASEYALIDSKTLEPRPNYWAALLWRRTMGTTVLERPGFVIPGVELYFHCLRDDLGGVAILAENLSETSKTLALKGRASVNTMTAQGLDSSFVQINGHLARMNPDGTLPRLVAKNKIGAIALPPHSITFLAVRGINNPACLKAVHPGSLND